jgi:hypothetical protein
MKRSFLFAAAVCSMFAAVSCSEKEKAIDKDFAYSIPTEAIVGETVTVEDLSINVDSRTWTFEDATPATSSEAIVDVVFSKAGSKAVTLTVNYADGTKDEITRTVEVKDVFSATIAAAGLTEHGCAAKGTEITFSLADFKNAAGGDVTYAWSFPGATPATSTEASPKVVWNDQINNVTVTCEVVRAFDGAKLNLSTSLVAGNYPLLKVLDEDKFDVYGFEYGETNLAWYTWVKFPEDSAAGEHPESMTIVDGGANGTAKALKLNISAIVNGSDIYEFAHRNSWPTNATLEAGKTYEISFWLKADGTAACYWFNVFSYVPDWLNDPLRGLAAATYWEEYIGGSFEVSTQTNLYSNAITTVSTKEDGSYDIQNLLTEGWTKYSFEFTPDGEAGKVYHNCYLCMGLSGVGANVYIDEVQINLIEK